MNDSQRETIEFLGDPGSYTPRPYSIERRETHGAIVFLAGDCAYKLKRAVRYPYMDYSTVIARKAMCERELSVNRRTAPELYLNARPIVRRADGTLGFGQTREAHDAIDWVVVMRRFPESGLLAEMQRRSELTPKLMRQLAEEIAAFHIKAAPAAAHGGAERIRAVIDENAALLQKLGFDPVKCAQLTALSYEALGRTRSLLERRRDEGKVRRCHGDLHLNNICLIGERPVLFDAIEFNEDFACIDVLYDVAFLIMDVMRYRLQDCANILLNRYLEMTGDYQGLAALPLFLSCRAAITAHVTVSRLKESQAHDAAESRKEAARLLDLAIEALTPHKPQLIAIGGLSGTGKSTLAYALANFLPPAPGAIVLRSDILRKHLYGVADSDRLPTSAYAPQIHNHVYATLMDTARSILVAGYSVIVDAVFGQSNQRAEISRIATDVNVPFSSLWLEAPFTQLGRRITARRDDASDANVQIVRKQVAEIAKPLEWHTIDASGTSVQTFAAAKATLEAIVGLRCSPRP